MAVAERFLDSHCHLDFPEFANDLSGHLAEWRAQGVGRLVVPAVGRHNWARVSQLAARYDGVYAALGVHPYYAEQHGLVDVEGLRAAIVGSESQIVAVGEIGLDASKPDMPHQRDLFIAQLALAQELDLPAIIHSFKTHSQILGDLRRLRVMRGVVHAFSGSQQDAARFVDQGMMLGVGAVITWSPAGAR